MLVNLLYRSIVDFELYLRNWQKNNQYIRNDVRDRIAKMHRLRGQAFGLLRLGTDPIGFEIGPTKEKQGEKVANHPHYNDDNHDPVEDAKASFDPFGEDASIEEKKAQFDARKCGHLDKLARPASLSQSA